MSPTPRYIAPTPRANKRPVPKKKLPGLAYDGGACRVFHGDMIKLLPSMGQYPLVFMDPPFNIGQNYEEYNDNQDVETFKNELRWWVRTAWEATEGVLCLHGPDALCEQYLQIAKTFKMRRIAWINWHYRFGQCGRGNWIDSRCHCLVYSKTKKYTWNPDDVLVESDRIAYGDKRTSQTENGGKRVPFTVWGIPSDGAYWGRVQGNSTERVRDRPNQLPEVYLERLIRAYTNTGDRVLDPFSGSGTTAVVAEALGRKCDCIDVDAGGVKATIDRIKKGAVRING
jgi:site-specific DNA-methyltransferase (adenine-specific)